MYYVIVQVVTDQEKSRFQVLRRNSSSFCNQAFHQSQLSEPTQTRLTTQDSEGTGESHHSHFPEDHEKMASESDGLSAISPIEHNFVPATERYAHATVLYMDIVGFTHQCAAAGRCEISGAQLCKTSCFGRIQTAVDAVKPSALPGARMRVRVTTASRGQAPWPVTPPSHPASVRRP